MTQGIRDDRFWKVISAVLLVVLIVLVAFVLLQNQHTGRAFYESASTPRADRSSEQLRSDLAALPAGIDVDHGSIYWIADLAEKALPFVVNIRTEFSPTTDSESAGEGEVEDFMREWQQMIPGPFGDDFEWRYEQPEGFPPPQGEGSGFLIREDGYIVTNAHVVESANTLTVRLYDGTEYEAELVGTDSYKDVAVLKINGRDLPVCLLGDSDEIRIGEPVVAIGSPLGIEATVTAGIISSNNRSLEDLGRMEDVRKPQHYLQTDAAINQGNSGGPLLNADGEVIGINQAIARWEMDMGSGMVPIEGIGFAIPINEVKTSIEQIVERGKDVVYPGISATIASVADYLSRNPGLELGVDHGVYVVRVIIDGPADRAGIRAGDVVLSIDDVEVNTGKELISEIQRHHVGDRVTLRVAPQGGEKREDITVVLGELDLTGVRAGE